MLHFLRRFRFACVLSALAAVCAAGLFVSEPLSAADDAYQPPYDSYNPSGDAYQPPDGPYPPPDTSARSSSPYRPGGVYNGGDNYRRYDGYGTRGPAPAEAPSNSAGYGDPYPPPNDYERYDDYSGPPPPPPSDSYSQNEIVRAGHGFFGSVSKGLASVIEYTFQKAGRPNGYILGEDAGGAFIAGLRYGEGTLYTKDAGVHRVFWQGPSVGYDFGGEGSKTMVLVYNLRDPSQIYKRYGGVQGSAYLVGGVGVQFQKHGNVTLAPIRAGIGLRLGANIGYLKYTRSPTWNPF